MHRKYGCKDIGYDSNHHYNGGIWSSKYRENTPYRENYRENYRGKRSEIIPHSTLSKPKAEAVIRSIVKSC